MVVFEDLPPLHGLRVSQKDAAAKLPHGPQLGGDSLDLRVVLAAAPLLQGFDKQVHLTLGLLVLDGQKHPGFDEHELGGHGDKLAGHLQVHPLPPLQVLQILVQDQGDRNVRNLYLIFRQQVEDQIQGPLEVLHSLPAVHHALQLVDRAVHPVTSISEK